MLNSERWRQVDKIFHEALKQEPNERDGFIEGECAGDASLRKEIETLIRAHNDARSFMETPAAHRTMNIGTQLGSLELTALLGKGGMGEVYRARDAKLKRDVAVKILPPEFSSDPDRARRFQREAEVLAALNHPNIAAIYDVEEAAGSRFLVLELVEGETLAERIRRGPIPLDEALQIAKSICEALEAAHEKGIVHRDLKPANVKITPEGAVKVLDFGLAKAFSGDPARSDPSESPTLSAMATLQGTILGTAAYMSPEQARARKVDSRTDIWALGCVLFEMLTGKPAFPGEDVTEILAAVLKSEPDWVALPPGTPANIRFVLRRCLEKDAKRRFHSAADVQIQTEEALAAPAPAFAAVAVAAAQGSWRRLFAWGVIGITACTATGVGVWKFRPSPSAPVVARFIVSMPPGRNLYFPTTSMCSSIAVSPDGKLLAYVTVASGANQNSPPLYIRSIDNLDSRPVTGSDPPGSSPVFSPDGQWLAFGGESKLKKVATDGGAPVTIANMANCATGAAWSAADDIILSLPQLGLLRVSATGGASPQTFIAMDRTKAYAPIMPDFLPGDRAILFSVYPAGAIVPFDEDQIVVRKLDTGEQRVLIEGGTSPHYVRTGHLLFVRSGTIMAVPFDLKRLEIKGRPVAIVEGLARSAAGLSEFSVSQNGTLAYISGDQGTRTLVWVDRNGVVQPVGAPPRAYSQPQISPDGRQIVVGIENPKNDVWVYEIARGTLTRLTFEGNNNSRPLWTPDGRRILFRSDRPGLGSNLFTKLADGTGAEEQITTFVTNLPSSITSDGKRAFFYKNDGKTRMDIWTVPLEGERKPAIVLQTPFSESGAKISPDGMFLAYHSDESGRVEVYVRSFPGPGGKWQISTDGGTGPVWSRNGRELFYRNGDKMMAVDITPGPSFKAGTPHMLFEGKFETRPGGPTTENNYDISPDGQHFLMVKGSAQSDTAAQLHVVLNWFEELKQRVPVK